MLFVCQIFCRHSEKLALPILAILHVILVLAHVLLITLHITWEFMHEDENFSLLASVSCPLMTSYRKFLLSLFSVLFLKCSYRALVLLFGVYIHINVDVVINYVRLCFVVLLLIMTHKVSKFLIFFCLMGETKYYFKLSKCINIHV